MSARGVREGYPIIDDPSHKLWAAQEAGWPDHLPHEAWTEVVALAPVAGFASSDKHPAYDAAYLGNAYAMRPVDEEPEQPARADKERR